MAIMLDAEPLWPLGAGPGGFSANSWVEGMLDGSHVLLDGGLHGEAGAVAGPSSGAALVKSL